MWLWGAHKAKRHERGDPVAVPGWHGQKEGPGCLEVPREVPTLRPPALLFLLKSKGTESLESQPCAPKVSPCVCQEPSKGSDF